MFLDTEVIVDEARAPRRAAGTRKRSTSTRKPRAVTQTRVTGAPKKGPGSGARTARARAAAARNRLKTTRGKAISRALKNRKKSAEHKRKISLGMQRYWKSALARTRRRKAAGTRSTRKTTGTRKRSTRKAAGTRKTGTRSRKAAGTRKSTSKRSTGTRKPRATRTTRRRRASV